MKVEQLVQKNEMLMGINEEHVKTFQDLSDKIQVNKHTWERPGGAITLPDTQLFFQQLGLEMAKKEESDQQLRTLLVPTPTKLTYKFQDGEEKSFVDIAWENTVPMDVVNCG